MTAEATAGLENGALAIAAAGPRPWGLPRLDWRPLLLGLALPLLAALAWEAAVRSGLATGRLVPPPSRVAVALWKLARSGELWPHVGATAARVGAGFALGGAAGILSGLAASYSPCSAAWWTRHCRACAPSRRWPGCHCSCCGWASSKPPRSR
ncbi:hypothetical protein UAJ10_05055 [Nitrospirillum sp. BR 11164]|uniref:hypothetical protein n=1 Tax=Nitrospirillum sp. BR 11164 TaxID=3104324 RepID=UPI002AFDDA5A|nr:hypothetical protein [Nitrospirillum sp. BR 11164]MEA1648386.1 hypothetical protein [Nitrospirillum sp. BR 11164]